MSLKVPNFRPADQFVSVICPTSVISHRWLLLVECFSAARSAHRYLKVATELAVTASPNNYPSAPRNSSDLAARQTTRHGRSSDRVRRSDMKRKRDRGPAWYLIRGPSPTQLTQRFRKLDRLVSKSQVRVNRASVADQDTSASLFAAPRVPDRTCVLVEH